MTLNRWGTMVFQRSFILGMLEADPHRGHENWLRMVPAAYRADMVPWVERFNQRWASQKATSATFHALTEDLLRFIDGLEPRDPIPDDGQPWIADPPPWEWRPEEHHRRMADVLASGTTRPGYQASPATRVEGREAPRGGGFTPRALQLDRAAAAMPDIEACARAAYEAEHNGQPRYLWETPESSDYAMRPEVKERFRRIARAVLAAAGVGR